MKPRGLCAAAVAVLRTGRRPWEHKAQAAARPASVPPPACTPARHIYVTPRRRKDEGKSSGDVLVPAPTWSIHDLCLLQKDATAGAGEPVSQEELSRLEGYAHVDLAGKAMDRNALQRDLGSIISCMKLLQTADLSSVSKEDMYAVPNDAHASTPLREDVVTEGGPDTQEQVLANTKETARHQFVVPLVNRK